jgi:hypothetical protein
LDKELSRVFRRKFSSFNRRTPARGSTGVKYQWRTTVAGVSCGFHLKSGVGAPIEARRPGPDMTSDHSNAPDDDHRVVPFRRRRAGARGGAWRWPLRPPQPPPPPVEGLAKYEGGDLGDDDDYRHRMMVNLAALAFTVVLALAGVWLVIQLADMRKNQDCVLSGRRNCAPIEVKAPER